MAAPASSSSSSGTSGEWLAAARLGEWSTMNRLVDADARLLTARDAEGRTALTLACEEGQEECVDQLLQRGAKVDDRDAAEMTPLMHAAEAGASGALSLLLAYGASGDGDAYLDVNSVDSRGDTALLKAARALALPCVQALLDYTEQKVDVELANEAGETPLLAVASCSGAADAPAAVAVLKCMLSHANRPKLTRANKVTRQTALHLAVATQQFDVLKVLSTAEGAQVDLPDALGWTPLMHCVEDDLPVFATHLLDVCHASQTVQNLKGYTALHLAVRDFNEPLVALLVQRAPPDLAAVLDAEFGWTCLQHATAKNQPSVLKTWGERGLDVTARDRRGSSALHLAARYGFLPCAKWLLKFGARKDERDLAGNTPILDAAAAGHTAMVQLLREKGAVVTGPEGADQRGNNVLHKLCAKESGALHPAATALATLVLEGPTSTPALAGELVHAVNADGDTPWMLAHRNSHAPLLALFARIATANVPTKAPTISRGVSGDGGIIVHFTPSENDRFCVLDLTYEITATPVLLADDDAPSADKSETVEKVKTKSAVKKSSTKKASTTSSAAAAPSTKAAKPPSVKKKSTSSSSSSSSSAASKKSSSSSSAPRQVVTAQPIAQVVRGSTSPLRVSSLINGVTYTLSVTSCNAKGSSSPRVFAENVLVGVPSPPSITSVTTGDTWASVAFLPSAAGIGKAAVTEFLLTVAVSAGSPRHSAPASSTGGGPMFRTISCVASPVLLTNLNPGLTYTVSLRARNGFGQGAPSGDKSLVVGSLQRPSTATPHSAPRLITLTTDLDATEINEAGNLLASSLASDLVALTRAQRKRLGEDAGHGFTVRSVRRIEHSALRSSFERAGLFMQAVGCSRAESSREDHALLCVTDAQARAIAANGLLPFAHPLSHAFSSSAAAAAESYNPSTYPIGSPFKGCYVSTTLTRRMLLTASSAAASKTSDSASAVDVHRVLLCKVLPGRARAEAPGSTATDLAPSALFDSHRGANGSIFLYSPAQVLPLFVVEFTLELEAAADEVEVDALEAEAAAAAALYTGAPLLDAAAAAAASRPFGVSKWMGAAPVSSIEPPGELPADAERAAESFAATSSSPGRAQYDDEDDEERPLDINKAQSSALGPVTAPPKKPSATAAVARTTSKKK